MQLFLHKADGTIRIINDALSPSEFTCSADDFAALEPDYPGLPAGAEVRYWTLEQSYVKFADGALIVGGFDGGAYTAKVSQYAAALPCIYADVQVSADRLNINGGTLTFQGWIKDGSGNVLPVTESWIIRLRDADGEECDAIQLNFVNGQTPEMTYTCPPNANLGRIHVDENDFESVTIPGVGTFQIRLLNPVEFTIFRTL